MNTNKTPLIDPAEYRAFLKQYIKDLYDIDAPMIAGAVERCLQKLDSQSTVYAVEVVRCKDCEHSKCEKAHIPGDMDCREFQIYKCHHPAIEVGSEPLIVEANDFCSYGERRST